VVDYLDSYRDAQHTNVYALQNEGRGDKCKHAFMGMHYYGRCIVGLNKLVVA